MTVRRRMPSLVLLALSTWMATSFWCAKSDAERVDQPSPSASLRIAPKGEPGDRLVMTGRILDGSGRPVPDATLSVYHADANGDYAKPGDSVPRLSGKVRVGRDGAYRIETVVPSQIRNQEGGLPHIHGTAASPGGKESGFVVNLSLAQGRHDDARQRASAGSRGGVRRTIYQDRQKTWWLAYDVTVSIGK